MADATKRTRSDYYTAIADKCLETFDQEAAYWMPVLSGRGDPIYADATVKLARLWLQALIPTLPDIGGDANPFMREFLRSARYLALFKAVEAAGRSPAEAGKVVYDAILLYSSSPTPLVPPPLDSPSEELHRRNRELAERSQARAFPGDYVYAYVAGDGVEFDFGYDFTECASHKLYREHHALAFLPYFCFTDFALSRLAGHGLSRARSLSEGHGMCNHRMKQGRTVEPPWPPAFLTPDPRM